MSEIDWSLVPKDRHGFVVYNRIPSMQVRIRVAREEFIRLKAQLQKRLDAGLTLKAGKGKRIQDQIKKIVLAYPDALPHMNP